MLVNIWKSTYSGQVYEIPVEEDSVPQYGGWELLGTVTRPDPNHPKD